MSRSQRRAQRAGSRSGVAGKASVLQSSAREAPDQVKLDLDDGFPEVPCFTLSCCPEIYQAEGRAY